MRPRSRGRAGAGGAGHRDEFGEEGFDLGPRGGGDGFQCLGAGIEAFGDGAVGEDQFVSVEQEMVVVDAFRQGAGDARQADEVLGGDQHLFGLRDTLGEGGAQAQAVLGRYEQGAVVVQDAFGDADGGVGPVACHGAGPDPEQRLAPVVHRLDAVAGVQILDRDGAAVGEDAGAGGKADDVGVFHREARGVDGQAVPVEAQAARIVEHAVGLIGLEPFEGVVIAVAGIGGVPGSEGGVVVPRGEVDEVVVGLDRVAGAGDGVEIGDEIGGAVDDEDVGPRAAGERVGPRAAVEAVVAQTCRQHVIARAAEDRVVHAVGAVDRVAIGIGIAGAEGVVARRAVDDAVRVAEDRLVGPGRFGRGVGGLIEVPDDEVAGGDVLAGGGRAPAAIGVLGPACSGGGVGEDRLLPEGGEDVDAVIAHAIGHDDDGKARDGAAEHGHIRAEGQVHLSDDAPFVAQFDIFADRGVG